MTRARKAVADRIWPEGETPPHRHVFAWADDGDAYESSVVGVCCVFTWLIPPGPRGKTPRVRGCYHRFDMDEILRIINQTATPNRKKR